MATARTIVATDSVGSVTANVSPPLPPGSVPTDAGLNGNPDRGLLTWNEEGQEGGPNHSRRVHVPGDSSGVTIGRGYDVSQKTELEVRHDMNLAGVKKADVDKFVACIGKTGDDAKQCKDDQKLNGVKNFEISKSGQLTLFEISYRKKEQELLSFINSSELQQVAVVDWEKVDPKIKEVVIDLRYRGDYRPSNKKHLQKIMSTNDLPALGKLLDNRVAFTDNLVSSAPKRFEARSNFVRDEIKFRENTAELHRLRSTGAPMRSNQPLKEASALFNIQRPANSSPVSPKTTSFPASNSRSK